MGYGPGERRESNERGAEAERTDEASVTPIREVRRGAASRERGAAG